MKSSNISKEILLFTNTSFARREFCHWNDKFFKEAENATAGQSKSACWSELIFDIMPGGFRKKERQKLCVWKVNQTEQFIHVELGSTPAPPQYRTSIDPYYFLPLIIYHN